jgi:hypothetical protein
MAKIRDALAAAERFFLSRDRSNAAVHLASSVRFSPLTTTVQAERERADRIMEEK